MKTLKPVVLSAALLVAQGMAAMADDICALSYETYEFSVPHTDMETCPASFAVDGAFCRGVLNTEIFTVYAFSETDGCLIASRAYEPGQYAVVVD